MKSRNVSLGAYIGLLFLATAIPAFAGSSTNDSSVLQLSTVNGAIQDIVNLCTGPVAKLIAIFAVVGGAVAFSQGREMHDGMKNLGIVAICIGLLIGAVNIIGAVGAHV